MSVDTFQLVISRLKCLAFFLCCFFFFNDTATTEIYTLSLHDALPIWGLPCHACCQARGGLLPHRFTLTLGIKGGLFSVARSEEHTSELQSPCNLVCRLLLEKKNSRNSSEAPPPLERWMIFSARPALVS